MKKMVERRSLITMIEKGKRTFDHVIKLSNFIRKILKENILNKKGKRKSRMKIFGAVMQIIESGDAEVMKEIKRIART